VNVTCCLQCFSENIDQRAGGKIMLCRDCGAQHERSGDHWRRTNKSRERANIAFATAFPEPVSRGALELVDGLRFNVQAGLERLARTFREDFTFLWRCISPGEQAALKGRWAAAGGISIWVLPAPLISPGGHGRVNGYVIRDGSGVELAISEVKLRTMGSIALVAHELGHAAGEQTEIGAWGVAHRWLTGTGVPAAHAFKAFLDAGGRDVALTSDQARRWGFREVALGG
jgi:hypothetical protein